MGSRLLSLEWSALCVGTGKMGDTTEAKLHSLDAGPLGTRAARLGVARGPLALSPDTLQARVMPNMCVATDRDACAALWIERERRF
jgi:hypothetical protein